MKEHKTVQERLIELTEYYHISQQDVSNRTGLEKSTISNYFNGKRNPKQDKISIIADAYGIDPAWLMGYDVPMIRIESKVAVQNVSVNLNEEQFELITQFANADEQTRRIVAYALKMTKYFNDNK